MVVDGGGGGDERCKVRGAWSWTLVLVVCVLY